MTEELETIDLMTLFSVVGKSAQYCVGRGNVIQPWFVGSFALAMYYKDNINCWY